MKSDPRTSSIAVVVLTSSQEHMDVVERYHLEVINYIVKPVNFERIGTAAQELGLLPGLAQSAAQTGEIS